MIDIVLDTNVFVATLLQPKGVNSRTLRKILSRSDLFKICYSSQMFAEYHEGLSRPVITARGLHSEAQALLEIIQDVGEEVIPKPVYALLYPDRNDRPFLEAVVYVNGILITNNLKDFPFAGISVLGPEEFLTWCTEHDL